MNLMQHAHGTRQMTTSEHEAQLATFLRMCSNEERNLEEGEIDKTFTCPLTLDIFMDPVLALSGVSYERNAIHDWLQAHLNDPRDPTTGSQLRAGQLKTNIGLCNATRKYLEERPWAWGAT